MTFPHEGATSLSLTSSRQVIDVHIDNLLNQEKGFEQYLPLFFKNLQKNQKHTILKGLIIDLTPLKPFRIQKIDLFNNLIIPKILQIGIKNVAIIKPKNVFAQFSVEDILERISEENIKSLQLIHIKLFEHKEQAKNWIK